MKCFCIFVCISVFAQGAYAESLIYTVMKGKDEIGSFRIERTKQNNKTEYASESTVKVNMLFTISVYDKMNVIYDGNRMKKAFLYRTLNGRVRVKNEANWNGKEYTMTNKDQEPSLLKNYIYHTTASLYYIEPKYITSVFSEKFQKMVPVIPLGANTYSLQLPDGNKTKYTYRNGICSLVEADTDWATIKFVLIKYIP
ncbi:MAG: DUF6134 family protein [Chitinophagaceae bacterium]